MIAGKNAHEFGWDALSEISFRLQNCRELSCERIVSYAIEAGTLNSISVPTLGSLQTSNFPPRCTVSQLKLNFRLARTVGGFCEFMVSVWFGICCNSMRLLAISRFRK